MTCVWTATGRRAGRARSRGSGGTSRRRASSRQALLLGGRTTGCGTRDRAACDHRRMRLTYYFGMHPFGAGAIVVSATVLYLALSAVLRRYGQRLYASPSSFNLAIVTVLGAVVGRAILGQVPTLAGGLLALATLFLVEGVAGRIRGARAPSDDRHRAVAVMVNGEVDTAELVRRRITEPALWSALRIAGVRTPAEVALVVLEA